MYLLSFLEFIVYQFITALPFVTGGQNEMPVNNLEDLETSKLEARRAFLKNCAKYAVAMPPAISLLVSAQSAFGQDEPNPNCSRLCADNFPATGQGCFCPEDLTGGESATTDPSSDPELNNPEANP